ncbi:hypothetical protein DEU56DRAFT_758730 [Suillus clintonianus]|uniref:uncharacterized protein n=1 Tax=Suillus clintonianus TaxID=1904413 RepID=UPI001B87DDF0|nr:uncharacterized protein DEU56DRAFT_758730 [Suillus clintonianus]KAG2126900.1 hypothetical protein DEU56DRAFT_758730 [Suillus clintonianus]
MPIFPLSKLQNSSVVVQSKGSVAGKTGGRGLRVGVGYGANESLEQNGDVTPVVVDALEVLAETEGVVELIARIDEELDGVETSKYSSRGCIHSESPFRSRGSFSSLCATVGMVPRNISNQFLQQRCFLLVEASKSMVYPVSVTGLYTMPPSHNPLASTPSSAASFSTPRLPQLPPLQESPLASFSRPAPLLSIPLPPVAYSRQTGRLSTGGSSVSPGSAGAPLPPMPTYQPSSLLTPYTRNAPSSSVPLPGPPLHTLNSSSRQHGNRNRTYASRKPYDVPRLHKPLKEQTLVIELVMYPHDFMPLPSHVEDTLLYEPITIPCPDRLPSGETFASQLQFLSQQHCTYRLELHASSPNDVILDQVYTGVHNMMELGSLEFPTYSDMAFDLDQDEENRNIRVQYARLPFRLLMPGNRSRYPGRPLSVDTENSWRQYTFSALRKLAKRVDHPSGQVGVLLLCPKDGAIIGPIVLGSTEKHAFFADRIHYFLENGEPCTRMSCHLGCPWSSQSSQRRHSLSIATNNDLDSDSSSAESSHPSPIDLTESPVILSDPLPELARHSSTLVSPTMQLLNIELAQPPPRTGTLATQTHEPLVRSISPQPLSSRTIYTPSQPPSLVDLAVLDRDVRASGPEHLRNSVWHVRSESLESTVKGLLAFIIQARHRPDGPFNAPPDLPTNFTLIPNNVRLHEVWTMHWLFRAGRSGDTIGDGVTHQVLYEAICVASNRTCQDVQSTEDGFVFLQVDEFPDADQEDYAFALGVLCTMFLLRVHSAPLPVSPALLQVTIGGIDSLVDSAWLEAILPDMFNVLKLFPSSAGAAQDFSRLTPQEVQDLQRILCHVGKQTLAQLSCTRAAQWPNMIRALHASLLLGVRAPQLHESTIYAAFRQGLDQALSPTHHSFIGAISNSSKFLLYEAYSCRRLSSPLQLFPLLSFDVLGDADFENDMATLLPNLREHVERYFKGVGHPADPLFTNLVSSAQLATDNQDICYRARRFVKLISGITLLPPGLRNFTITVHQDISISATFNGHYDVCFQSTIVLIIL